MHKSVNATMAPPVCWHGDHKPPYVRIGVIAKHAFKKGSAIVPSNRVNKIIMNARTVAKLFFVGIEATALHMFVVVS